MKIKKYGKFNQYIKIDGIIYVSYWWFLLGGITSIILGLLLGGFI